VLHEKSLKLDSIIQPQNTDKKLNMEEFNKKYESQRIKWERLKNSPPVDYRREEEEKELEEATFKPVINPKSKNLVRDLEKLENRVKVLYEGREKKIKEL
jgi:hypothetical protein